MVIRTLAFAVVGLVALDLTERRCLKHAQVREDWNEDLQRFLVRLTDVALVGTTVALVVVTAMTMLGVIE